MDCPEIFVDANPKFGKQKPPVAERSSWQLMQIVQCFTSSVCSWRHQTQVRLFTPSMYFGFPYHESSLQRAFRFFSRTCSALRQGNPRPPRKAGFWQLLRILRPGDSGALHLKTGLFATRLHKLRLCRTNRGCIARGVLVD